MQIYRFMFIVVLATACCTALASAAFVPVTEKDDGKTISARVGDTILLKLQENPSTGYTWTLSVTPGLIVTEDQHTPSILRRIGAPGMREWQIRVTGSGDQTVSVVYVRPWEPMENSAREFTLFIKISEDRSYPPIPASRISRQVIFDLLKRY